MYFVSGLRQHLQAHPSLAKALGNIGWLFFDKVLRLVVALIVGAWVARYLGPEQFGQLTYAFALVGLAGAIATLGLEGVVVRELVKEPATATLTLGTSFVLQLFGSLLAIAMLLAIVSIFRPQDLLTLKMVGILGLALCFQSGAIFRYWYESQVNSRYTVWVANAVYILISAIKVGLILYRAPVIAFAWIVLVESLLVTAGLVFVYSRQTGALSDWRFGFDHAKKLLKASWPLMLSGVAIMVYMRIDQVMLGEMVGQEAVGLYSAALRLSELWYMIPMVVTASVFPSIMLIKERSTKLYNLRMQQLMSLLVIFSVSIAIVVTFAGDLMIQILFGSEFAGSADVLRIHTWAGVFVFVGVAGSKWYLAAGLERLTLYRTLAGAAVNVALNLVLIPRHGIAGAAVATVVSQLCSAYLFDCTSAKSLCLFKMKTLALFLGPYFLVKNYNNDLPKHT